MAATPDGTAAPRRVPPPGSLPPPDDAHLAVWWASIDVTPGVLEGLRADLDADTLGRVNAFVREEDRRRGIVAHGLLRRLVAACAGIAAHDVAIERVCATCGSADHGKPALVPLRRGQRPPLQFNLAHSGGVVAVALAGPGTDVGVDVEALQPHFDWTGARRHVFTDEEWTATNDAPDPASARFHLWARKEAAAKTTGHGLAIDLSHVNVGGPAAGGGFDHGTITAPEATYPIVVRDLVLGAPGAGGTDDAAGFPNVAAAVATRTGALRPGPPPAVEVVQAALG